MSETLIKVIKAITGVILAVLGLEAILRLLGALPTVLVFQWIYDLAAIIKSPFAEILEPIVFGSRFVLDLSTLFAMFAYLILAWILIWLIKYVAQNNNKH